MTDKTKRWQWVKLHTSLLTNADAPELSDAAFRLWTMSLLKAADTLTDTIDLSRRKSVAAWSSVPVEALEAAAQELVAVDWWMPEPNGVYRIKDFRTWQPAFPDREAAVAQGKAGGNTHWHQKGRHEGAPVEGCPLCEGLASPPKLTATEVADGLRDVTAAFLSDYPSDPMKAWRESLIAARELAQEHEGLSPKIRGMLLNRVVGQAAETYLEGVPASKYPTLFGAAKAIGEDGPEWVIAALLRTAGADVEDPVRYVAATAKRMRQEALSA